MATRYTEGSLGTAVPKEYKEAYNRTVKWDDTVEYTNPITGKKETANLSAGWNWGDGYQYNNMFRTSNAGDVNLAVKFIMEQGSTDIDKLKTYLEDHGRPAPEGEMNEILRDARKYIIDLGYSVDEITNAIRESKSSTEKVNTPSDSGLDYYKSLIEDSLATNKNSEFAKQYQADMYNSINSYEQATNATLAAAELDAYKMLGQQQLQLENQIAAQRMQALKSGVTSAQLASQELANMFAAQSSAQQIAQNVLSRRTDVANTFNQQRVGVTDNLYNMLANNQTTAANAYAQLGAAQASYNSYIQQPYSQYDALMQAYNKYGSDLEKAMGYKE